MFGNNKKQTRCRDCHKFVKTVWEYKQVSEAGDFEPAWVIEESYCESCADKYLPID